MDSIDSGAAVSAVDDPSGVFRTRREFYKARDIWLEQVVSDPKLPPAAFKIAYVLAIRYLNWKTFDAYPGHLTLAEAAHLSDRWVRKSLAQLNECGHLLVTVVGRGATRATYRPNLFDENWSLLYDRLKATKRASTTSRR